MIPDGPMHGADGMAPFAQHDAWWAGPAHLLPLLLFAALLGVLVWGVLRLTPRAATAADGAVPTIPARDPAEEELRVSYARGEIDRATYLERAADLGTQTRPDRE